MPYRFFVPPDRIMEGTVLFTPEQSRQITRVLRLRPGELTEVLDNTGSRYAVRLDTIDEKTVRGAVLEQGPARGEPGTRLHLWQGLLKGERWEWVLQKGTEVGISAFHPVRCDRSVARDSSAARVRRWGAILQEAAEQCGRGRIPELRPVVSWEEACREAADAGLLLYEGERKTGLRVALAKRGDAESVHLLAGPEGGLTDREAATARDCGIVSVTLGPRVLRAETAGVIAAALVLYERGEI